MKMSLQNDRYTYRITWSEDDHEYVGLCVEFPSLSWLAKNPEGALQGIRKLVDNAVTDMRNNGETPPSPMSNKKFSGKFVVRLPPEVHRELAIKAAEQGISLNRWISSRLSNI
jgi:predicted HicB family RNase H-like nuclease